MKKELLLIAMMGYPGSGKTYFSERISKTNNFFHLNSDKVRSELFKEPTFTVSEHKKVFSYIDRRATELLEKGVSVVVDANSPLKSHRDRLKKIAHRFKARFLIVHIITSENLAQKRILKRKNIQSEEKKKYNRLVAPEVFNRLKNMIEKPSNKEKFIEIVGTDNFKKQIQKFEKEIKKIKIKSYPHICAKFIVMRQTL